MCGGYYYPSTLQNYQYAITHFSQARKVTAHDLEYSLILYITMDIKTAERRRPASDSQVQPRHSLTGAVSSPRSYCFRACETGQTDGKMRFDVTELMDQWVCVCPLVESGSIDSYKSLVIFPTLV